MGILSDRDIRVVSGLTSSQKKLVQARDIMIKEIYMYKKVLNVLVFVLLTQPALARYDNTGTSETQIYDRFQILSSNSWTPFVGFGAGYTGYNSHLDVEGTPSVIKLMGSYLSPRSTTVLDFGIGLGNQTFSQESARDQSISATLMEVAARHQFENQWQFGAVYNQFFNKGENFFANQADAQFAGLQFLKQFDMGRNFIGRIGASAMASVNVNDETVGMILINFNMGWDQKSKSYVSSNP